MEKEQRLKEAIEKVISVAENLSQSEWHRMVSVINQRYTAKAAKVKLDGNELILIEKSLKLELLGEKIIQ